MKSSALITDFETGLRAFVRARIANPADAEDVLQDILLKLHLGADTVQDDERVAGWVFRVARNTVTDHYRKGGTDVTRTPDREIPAEIEPLFDVSAESELANCVRPFLADLDDRYRDAVTMVDLQGMTHSQAAAEAGVSLSGMKSRVQRGRAQLRGSIEECCFVEKDARGTVVGYEPKGSCS